MQRGGAPILVLNAKTKRENGNVAQFNNIKAAKAVSDVIRTCLGPKAMLKMILSQSGQIIMTNDGTGNAILREVNVQHPAARTMIDLARTQDENVGDGTTSVTILGGELLALAEPWLQRKMHPRVLIGGYTRALRDALDALHAIARPIDAKNDAEVLGVIKSTLGTKFVSRWMDQMCSIALTAVHVVATEEAGRKEVDLKRYCHIEKIPGGEMSESYVVPGVVFPKDIAHPKMRRRIEKPRIVLLDCNLEFKKSGNPLTHKVGAATDWEKIMKLEEEAVKQMVMDIVKVKPDVVITEKGLSDEAQHWFVKHGITAMRRLRKTVNDRIARATGATIVSRTDEIKESDVGTRAGLFEIRKIGDEYYTFITDCRDPKACTILLRGASKEVLGETERNLHDALAVARNVLLDPRLCPGGGATEMAVAARLTERAKAIEGVEQWPYQAVAIALEVIPRTLLQNCGADIVRTLTSLRAKHATAGNSTWGVDGVKGVLVDMKTLGIWEPLQVKAQTLKTAIEAACMLLRIDDILSGMGKKGDAASAPGPIDRSMSPEEMGQ